MADEKPTSTLYLLKGLDLFWSGPGNLIIWKWLEHIAWLSPKKSILCSPRPLYNVNPSTDNGELYLQSPFLIHTEMLMQVCSLNASREWCRTLQLEVFPSPFTTSNYNRKKKKRTHIFYFLVMYYNKKKENIKTMEIYIFSRETAGYLYTRIPGS